MSQERKVALLVQARMNSQRVPRKMLRDFGGSTLFEIALDKIVGSQWICHEDVFIAVGDPELMEIASEYPFNIYVRSEESCNATNSDIPDSLKLLYEWYRALQEAGYTHVVLVSACHPLLSRNTIENFYLAFKGAKDLDGLFSVVKKKNYYWDKWGNVITDWRGAYLMNTRKVDHIWEAGHCLYGSKISFIENECWMGDTSPPKPRLYPIDKLECTDIDDEIDFQIAEVLYKHFIVE